jgi:hypothetical protein
MLHSLFRHILFLSGFQVQRYLSVASEEHLRAARRRDIEFSEAARSCFIQRQRTDCAASWCLRQHVCETRCLFLQERLRLHCRYSTPHFLSLSFLSSLSRSHPRARLSHACLRSFCKATSNSTGINAPPSNNPPRLSATLPLTLLISLSGHCYRSISS